MGAHRLVAAPPTPCMAVRGTLQRPFSTCCLRLHPGRRKALPEGGRARRNLPGAMLLHEPSDAGALAPRLIAEGDLVVVYERFDSMKGVKIDPKKSFDNKFGFFALKVWRALLGGPPEARHVQKRGWGGRTRGAGGARQLMHVRHCRH